MALLPDPTKAASERSPVKKRLADRRCGEILRESTCPFLGQHESTQQRGAYGPLTLLPHKMRVRHKKTGTGPEHSAKLRTHPESLGGQAVQGRPGGSRGSREGCKGGPVQKLSKHEKN